VPTFDVISFAICLLAQKNHIAPPEYFCVRLLPFPASQDFGAPDIADPCLAETHVISEPGPIAGLLDQRNRGKQWPKSSDFTRAHNVL
jgi:hypothetical protein